MAETPDGLATLWLNTSNSVEHTALMAERKGVVNIDVGLAKRIIDERIENGPFESLEDAQVRVSGFGPKLRSRFEAAFADFFEGGVVDARIVEDIAAGRVPGVLLRARDAVGGAPEGNLVGGETVVGSSGGEVQPEGGAVSGSGVKDIKVHPLVEKYLGGGGDDGGGRGIAILGYAGKSTRDGHVRLYQTLEDLSEFVDVPKHAITDVIEVGEDVLPGGACSFVISPGTQVHFGRLTSVTRDISMITGDVLLGNLGAEAVVLSGLTTITTVRTVSVRFCTPGGRWVSNHICTKLRKSLCTCWACGATATFTVVTVIECRDAIETVVGACATQDRAACYSAMDCRPTDPVMCTGNGCTRWRCAPTQVCAPQPQPTQVGICPPPGGQVPGQGGGQGGSGSQGGN